MPKISFQLLVCVPALLVLVACGAPVSPTAAVSPAASAAPNELREPPALTSVDGVLDLLVIAKPAVLAQFAPYRPTGWVYDICQRPADGSLQCPGGWPEPELYGGTRLQLSAGDVLKIRLVNHLPPNPGASNARGEGQAYLGLNPTNLHMHGMLVSPRYAAADDATWGDNVFVYNFNSANGLPALDSNLHGAALLDVVDYSIAVPRSHPSGLYWFHPHVHGISQNQITAGLSGIITVGHVSDYACVGAGCAQGVSDQLVTRHMILKDTEVLKDGTLQSDVDSGFCSSASHPAASLSPGQGGCDGTMPGYGNRDYIGGRWFFTINGQQYPTITVGAVTGQVWRIVNASASTTYHLDLWNESEHRAMLMRVISIDGVSIDVRPGAPGSQLADQSRSRFDYVPCASTGHPASDGVCTTTLHLMPSSRAEIWVNYLGADGAAHAPPRGAAAVLRTRGYWAGPAAEIWPAVDLAQVRFVGGQAAAGVLSVTAQASRSRLAQSIADDLRAANANVPVDPTCNALPAGHERRIFFNVTPTRPYVFGLGYEEIDAYGQPVPGTFVDVSAFDPTRPTVCVPLAAGNQAVSERWELVNLSGADHNFHLHQAHFTVLSQGELDGTAVPDDLAGRPVMMDSLPLVHADGYCATVADWRNGVCAAHPAKVQIELSIAGDFVYHCHILAHEDGGMMAVIRVRSNQSANRTGVVGEMLSALRLGGEGPTQPLIPRIGGGMCRVPASAGR